MGLFGELLAAAANPGGIDPALGPLTSIVRAGIAEDLSGSAILAGLKSVGLGIRRQNFYQLLGEVRSSLTAGAWAVGVDPRTLPTAAQVVPWSGGKTGQYLTRVNVYTRERVGEGDYQVQRRGLSFLSNQPISPAQAVQQAVDLPTGMAGTPVRQVLGYEYNGTYLQQ